jgi:RND family efflux transporter MFP subunit
VLDQQKALVEQLEAALAATAASIAQAEVDLSYTQIVTPVSGRVGLRRVDPGNLVRTSDAEGLVSVTQLAPIAVVFALPQELLPRVQALLAAPEPAPVDARVRAGGELIARGRLTLVDNQIDVLTGTIRVKAEFDNADLRLWPGQFVAVELETRVDRAALVVDVAALQRGLEQPFVYRVEGDVVAAVPVSVSWEDERIAVIGAGLAAGDVVVVDGQSRLKPGASVRVVERATDRAP